MAELQNLQMQNHWCSSSCDTAQRIFMAPFPFSTTIRRLKIRAQRHSAHNSARRKCVCKFSRFFCTQHTSTQKGKSRMAQHCTIASSADMETRKYLLHGVIVQRHCCKVAISKMQLHSSSAYTTKSLLFLLLLSFKMICNY